MRPATVKSCTDNDLHEAMYQFLRLGPGHWGAVNLFNGRRWNSSRAETKAAFAERFPRGMDKLKFRKPGK